MAWTDKIKKFANGAVDKGKNLAEQGKLALDNQKQNEAIKAAKTQIGAYVVDNNLLMEDAFVTEQLAIIAAADEALARNNARIAELKASEAEEDEAPEAPAAPTAAPAKRFCTNCGIEIAEGVRFCPKCGQAQ